MEIVKLDDLLHDIALICKVGDRKDHHINGKIKDRYNQICEIVLGYATEVLKRVIEFLLFDCDFHLVEARHHASNPASGRVMEKAGMKKDGVLRERRVNKLIDGYDDLVIYSITEADFEK